MMADKFLCARGRQSIGAKITISLVFLSFFFYLLACMINVYFLSDIFGSFISFRINTIFDK